jgi:hypothetical protein
MTVPITGPKWVLCIFCLLATPLLGAAASPEKPTPMVKGTKVDGVYHGPVEIWSTAVTRQAAGEFRHGKPDGRWTFWDEAGVKIVELTYSSGTFSGTVTIWHGAQVGPREKGRLKLRAAFNDGCWQGLVRTYYPDGRTRSERNYDAGIVIETQAYNPRGEPLTPEQSRKIAEEDEQVDNALVDALDEFLRKWVS